MQRSPVNKRSSHKSFKNRSGKTDRLNLATHRRGGTRL